MSRVVGFSLKLEGSSKTISDIEKIEKALKAINDQIAAVKKADLNAFKPLIESQAEFRKAIDATNKLIVEQTKILSKIGSKQGADKSLVDDLKKQISTLRDEIKLLKKELGEIKSPTVSTPSTAGFENLQAKAKEVIESLKGFAPAIEHVAQGASLDFINKLSAIELRLKSVKESIRNEKNTNNTGDTTNLTLLMAEEKALIETKKELTKQANAANKALQEQANAADPTSLVGMRQELSKLNKEYSLLTEEQRKSAEGVKLFNKIVGTTNEISTIEQSLGNFRRNVGNYQNAVQTLIPTLERLQKEGALANSALINSFKSDAKAKAAILKDEINKLAQSFERLSDAEKQGSAGVAVLEQLKQKATDLNNTTSSLPSKVNGVKQSFIGLGDIVTGGLISGGIIGAAGALKEFAAGSIEEFKQAENAIAKVRAQLVATGNASGQTAESLRGLAQDIEVRTGIDGDQILNDVTSKLLTFTRISGDAFERAQSAAIDLGQTLGGDLGGAAQLLGKALDNPIKGLTLLGKAGIYLDETTQKQIKNAVAANDLYKAQALILAGVEARTKGVADAINNSELRGLRQWTVDWNNFKEDVGRSLIEIGNRFFDFFRQVKDGTYGVPVGLKETTKGLNELSEALGTETGKINAYFSIIKNENSSRDERNRAIKELVALYPELLNKYELEIGSLDSLSNLEQNLTTTVRAQVFERVKLKTQEAVETEIANKKIELTQSKIREQIIRSGGDRSLFGAGLIGAIADEKERQIKISADLQKLEEERLNTIKALEQALNPDIDLQQIKQTSDEAQVKVEAAIRSIEETLKNPNLTGGARKQLLEFQKEFFGYYIDTNSSIDEIQKVYERSAFVNKEINRLLQNAKSLADDGKDTKKTGEDANKALEEQLKRIEELKKKLASFSSINIVNEFDKQIQDIKSKAQVETDDIKKKIKNIETPGNGQVVKVLTAKDKEELALLQDLLRKTGEQEQKEIDKVNVNRGKALRETKEQLRKLQEEVNALIANNVKSIASENLDKLTFDFGQQTRTINIKFDDDQQSLEAIYAKGEISQKEYEERSKEITKQRLSEQKTATEKYVQDANKLYDTLFNTEVELLKVKKEQADEDARAATIARKLQIADDFNAGKYTTRAEATKALKEADNNLTAALEKNQIEYSNSVDRAQRERVQKTQEAADKVSEIEKNATKNETDESEKAKQKRLNDLDAIKQAAINIAQTTADAIFEIEKQQAQAIYEQRVENLDREKEARLKLVKGNAAEEERINREFEAKKKKADDDLRRRQRDIAVKQAIINGALAITNIWATTPKADFGISTIALIAASIASTIAQIATIRKQSFAEGGFTKRVQHGFTGASQAPPDHTGRRPVGTAVIHEGEYFANAEQVRDYRPLFDALEEDRMNRKRGFGASFRYQHVDSKLAFKAVEAHEKRQAIRGVKYQPPVLYQYTHFMGGQNMSAVISDTVIESMASRIAEKAEQAIISGVHSGYANAVKTLAETELRKVNALNKSAI